MKKLIAILLCLAMVLSFAGCKKDGDASGDQPALPGESSTVSTTYTVNCNNIDLNTDPEIDAAADKLLNEIENLPDTVTAKDGGTVYYVSNKGNDDNDGTSEATPFATLAMANLHAKEGDCIKLERGGLWRGNNTLKEGVNYGAYGTGAKPALYGAKQNGVTYTWSATDDENIYTCQSNERTDIGLIVFDHGKAWGNKKSAKDKIKDDYDFYAERGTGKIYVYSSNGNPGEIFSDIEICGSENVVNMKSNSVVENWRIMYGGKHGIGMGSVENVEIKGCIIGYIGGVIQSGTTRLGNGIEVWGTCDGYTIDHCHVYQCYDAGITFQFSSDTTDNIYEENIHFTSNLLEYSNYNLEYFYNLPNSADACMRNVEIKDNIMRYGGYGWGYDSRPDKRAGTNVQGWGVDNRAVNFVYTNNIFDHSRSFLLNISAVSENYLPTFTGNTFAQIKGTYIAQKMGTRIKFGASTVEEIFGDKSAKVITYEEKK